MVSAIVNQTLDLDYDIPHRESPSASGGHDMGSKDRFHNLVRYDRRPSNATVRVNVNANHDQKRIFSMAVQSQQNHCLLPLRSQLVAAVALVIGLTVGIGDARATLIAHYEFENNFNDSSASLNHATGGTGGGSFVASGLPALGQAWSNNTGENALSINNLGISGAAPRTIGVWFNVNSAASNYVPVAIGGTGSNGVLQEVLLFSGPLVGHFHGGSFDTIGTNPGGSGSTPDPTYAASTWTHVAFAYDGTTMNVYKDGVLADSGTFSGSFLLNTTDAPVKLGGGLVFPNYDGLIDDVQIYDVALTVDQIGTLFAGGVVLPPVPEPSTFLLLGLGAMGLVRHTRRRRRRA